MGKYIFKTTILTIFLCLMALPVNALFYNFSSINTIGSWSNASLTGDTNVNTSLKITVFSNPAYATVPGIVTWSRLFFRFDSDRLVNSGGYAIQDTPSDILELVYPDTGGQYISENLQEFNSGQEEGPQPGVAPVPEPGTLLLIGSGIGGLLLYRKRRAG